MSEIKDITSLSPQLHLVNGVGRSQKAEILSHSNPTHIQRAGEIIANGGVVAGPFNGIYGLFGDMDDPAVAEKIFEAKHRPKDKKLIVVTDPAYISEIAELSQIKFLESPEQLEKMWRSIHALGIVLPASPEAPRHLVDAETNTVVNIWTEYDPIKGIYNEVRARGKRGFMATSANISGGITLITSSQARMVFGESVDAVVEANFAPELDPIRQPYRYRSTSMVDFTLAEPWLVRAGNVLIDELEDHLKDHGFPKLGKGRDPKVVRGYFDPEGKSVKTYRAEYDLVNVLEIAEALRRRNSA